MVKPKQVLERISKRTIFMFYMKSFIFGVWILIKWFIHFLWKSVNQKKNHNKTLDSYDGNIYDKPPVCLVDANCGSHSYVKLKGVKLHYVESGNKNNPLILLLHGYPDCWLGWRKQIPELSRFFRVIALDLKGFNDSDKPLWRHAYTPEQICKELLQFIQALGVKSVTIIGHDLGALIGWIFAHSYPDHIDRFICISTSHPNIYWNNVATKSVNNSSWLNFSQLPFLPEMEQARSDTTYLEKNLKHLIKDTKMFTVGSDKPKNESDIIDAYKYVFNRKNDWTGPLNYYRNFPFYRIKEGEMIRCPCLIISGNEDTFCRLESVVKSTDYCDNFIVKIIEGAKHWPHQEMADEFNAILLKFLVGRRASVSLINGDKNSKGIFGRMIGAVSNTTKIGSYVMDSVQQKTNDTLLSALQNNKKKQLVVKLVGVVNSFT